MPRVSPSVIQHAARINRYLPPLLQECRDLSSARNELRWMKETILEKHLGLNISTSTDSVWEIDQARIWHCFSSASRTLDRYVKRRARGEPLQYILGSQPFGELDIKCRPNVLIPRPETEVYTTMLAHILKEVAQSCYAEQSKTQGSLQIADFCTGSGCIALLLHSILRPPRASKIDRSLQVSGFDISSSALRLATENLNHNLKLGTLHPSASTDISFEHVDVLSLSQQTPADIRSQLFSTQKNEIEHHFDVIVSNPPYISPEHFKSGGPTTRSVRKYEPRLALVPPESLTFEDVEQADQFYAALLRIAIATRAKLCVIEVGDTDQALRVRRLCQSNALRNEDMQDVKNVLVEIWRDDGSVITANDSDSNDGIRAPDKDNEAECRAIVVWLDETWANTRRPKS